MNKFYMATIEWEADKMREITYYTNDIDYAMNYVRKFNDQKAKVMEYKNVTWEIEEFEL